MIAADRRWQHRAGAALAVVALTSLAACGDDENAGTAAAATTKAKVTPTLTLRAGAAGKDKLVLTAPATFAAGRVRIVLRNSDTRPREAQLVRVAGDQTVEQVLDVREADGARPQWFTLEGGVAAVGPGQTGSVIQALAPGTYYAIDAEKDGPMDDPKIPTHARLGATARFVVTGPARPGALPAVPATIRVKEYRFRITGLKAGVNRVRFDNVGKQAHHAILFPLAKGRTIADAKRFFGPKAPAGPPPVDFAGVTGTAAIEGGSAQIAQLRLRAGRYAVVCFLTNRKGGKEHVARGQVNEAIVG